MKAFHYYIGRNFSEHTMRRLLCTLDMLGYVFEDFYIEKMADYDLGPNNASRKLCAEKPLFVAMSHGPRTTYPTPGRLEEDIYYSVRRGKLSSLSDNLYEKLNCTDSRILLKKTYEGISIFSRS